MKMPKNKKKGYNLDELHKIARITNNYETLENMARDYFTNPYLCRTIACNNYISTQTLEILARHPCSFVRIAVATKGDLLTEKASLRLANDFEEKVKQELSRTTIYDNVKEYLLKNNLDNSIIVGNSLRRIKNVKIINNFITSADEYMLVKILGNKELSEQQLLLIMKTIGAKSYNLNITLIITHPNCTRNVFKLLIKMVQIQKLSDSEIFLLLTNNWIFENDKFLKDVLNHYNNYSNIYAIMSNNNVTEEVVSYIVQNFFDVISSNYELTKIAIMKSNNKDMCSSLIFTIKKNVDEELLEYLLNSNMLTIETTQILYNKISKRNMGLLQYFIKHQNMYPEVLYNIASSYKYTNDRIIQLFLNMLDNPNCNIKTLELIMNTNNFNCIKKVSKHPNCTTALKLQLFLKIRRRRKILLEDKKMFLITLCKHGGEEFISQLMRITTLNNIELTILYNKTNEIETKKDIVKIVSGMYLTQFVSEAIEEHNDEVLWAVKDNPNITSALLRKIFNNTFDSNLKKAVAPYIKWSSLERAYIESEGYL